MKIYVEELKIVLDKLNLNEVKDLIRLIKKSGTVWVIGNGGSMSTAAHLAEDLVKLAGKEAVSVSDSSLISMSANDEGIENMFYYPLKKLVKRNDLIIGLTMGGHSKNVLKVVEDGGLKCRKVLVTGLGGKDAKCNKFVIPCNDIQVLEDVCLSVVHMICKFYKNV